jgi:hypothetical protein
MLNNPLSWILLLFLLCVAWTSALRRTKARALAALRMKFEEIPNPDVFALKLDRN